MPPHEGNWLPCSYSEFSHLLWKSYPEGQRDMLFFSGTDLNTTTSRRTLSLCKNQQSRSLLPRISYSSTSSAEPESESRMEPWELNWDPLSVATRPGRNTIQPAINGSGLKGH